MRKERKEIEYIVVLLITILFIGVGIFLYYSNYNFILSNNMEVGFLDKIFSRGLFSFFEKGFQTRSIFLLLSLIALFYSKRERVNTLKFNLIRLGMFSLIFIGIEVMTYIGAFFLSQLINIITSLVAYLFVIRYLFKISAWLESDISLSQNDIRADGFIQNDKLITNDYSINFNYTYNYNKRKCKGKINVINPFRATYVLGTPGSGKSYAIVEEYLRQWIARGYCGVVYDYKDPALSNIAYNYWLEVNTQHGNNIAFKYISFQNLRKTYRCNPLKGISNTTDALEMANTILVSLNKNYIEKKGDFFVESSLKYTALNIMLLGIMCDGKYLSIPHLISVVGKKSDYIFEILNVFCIFNIESNKLFTAFKQAFDNKATEQLAGQLASAQIGLGAIADKSLAYVMTEGEDERFNINLDINNEDNPVILCIGNDPTKDTILGMANSVYLSRISKVINKKGVPCLYVVDELPTVYINGLDNLIATARSNKIATLLSFQDFSQLRRDYGDKVANVIINTVGNTFTGAVQGDTAKKIAESFGEKKINKISKSVSDGGVTISTQEQKEKKITEDQIVSLSQGEFCGRVADEFDTPTEHKTFIGSIHIDPKYKVVENKIPNIISEGVEMEYLLNNNLFKIENEVSMLLSQMQSIVLEYKKMGILTLITLKRDYLKVNPEERCVCLEDVINEDFAQQDVQEFLFDWIEQAFRVIYAYDNLEAKNNFFTPVQKIELLLRSLWTNEESHILKILGFIQVRNIKYTSDVNRERKSVIIAEKEKESKKASIMDDDYF